MQGIRFYLDHESPQAKRTNRHQGNVTAVIVENGVYYSGNVACYDGIGAVFFRPNSPVASTNVSLDWMHSCGKRISEEQAREIHPELFVCLDKLSKEWEEAAREQS